MDEEPNQHIVDSLPLESVTTHSNDTRNEDMADEVICQKFLLEGVAISATKNSVSRTCCNEDMSWPNCQEKNLTWL